MRAVAVESPYCGSKSSKLSKPLAKDMQIRPIQTAVNIETLAVIHFHNHLSAVSGLKPLCFQYRAPEPL
jgi:hypothetical protein